MTIETLQQLLTAGEGVSAWRIIDRRIEGRELFFIRRTLDMQRLKKVRHTDLTIYHDFEEKNKPYRGHITVRIHSSHTAEEMRTIIEESVVSTRQVRNEYYPLGKAPVGMSSSTRSFLSLILGPLSDEVRKRQRKMCTTGSPK